LMPILAKTCYNEALNIFVGNDVHEVASANG
jgi:hypothetical protein